MDTDLVVGEKYYWTDDYHLIIEDVEVVVKKVNSDSVVVEVVDEDKLEQDLRDAKKTYSKNGQDMDNALEVHPLVKGSNGTFTKLREHVIFDKSDLHELK